MARWDLRRRAEKQTLAKLDKTLGSAKHGQQQAGQEAEDDRLRQPYRKQRVYGILRRLRRKPFDH